MRNRESAIRFLLATLCCVLLVATGCATKKDYEQLYADMQARDDRADSRLHAIEVTMAEIDSLLLEQNDLIRGARALVGSQGMEQRDNLATLEARLDEMNGQLQTLHNTLEAIQLYGGAAPPSPQSQQPAPASTPAVPPRPSSGAATEPSAQDVERAQAAQQLYDVAQEDISNNRYLLAESRLLSFLMQNPDHELAGNAQYWIGEVAYAQEKYELAATEFEKVMEKYPKSQKVPAALLKLGYAQRKLGNEKAAAAAFNRILKDFPKSEEVALAREQLKQ